MKHKVFKVGIMSRTDYRKRTLAIARGEHAPKPGEPKTWFESLRSMSEVLSNDNQELLRMIVEKKPQSLAELEMLSGRNKGNLSRTLKTLERYGIVALHKTDHRLVPEVRATDFRVEFGIHSGG
jgi:predicted transcriptional regulator